MPTFQEVIRSIRNLLINSPRVLPINKDKPSSPASSTTSASTGIRFPPSKKTHLYMNHAREALEEIMHAIDGFLDRLPPTSDSDEMIYKNNKQELKKLKEHVDKLISKPPHYSDINNLPEDTRANYIEQYKTYKENVLKYYEILKKIVTQEPFFPSHGQKSDILQTLFLEFLDVQSSVYICHNNNKIIEKRLLLKKDMDKTRMMLKNTVQTKSNWLFEGEKFSILGLILCLRKALTNPLYNQDTGSKYIEEIQTAFKQIKFNRQNDSHLINVYSDVKSFMLLFLTDYFLSKFSSTNSENSYTHEELFGISFKIPSTPAAFSKLALNPSCIFSDISSLDSDNSSLSDLSEKDRYTTMVQNR